MSWGLTRVFNHWKDKIGTASRAWYGRLIAALMLVGALICLIDVLAIATHGAVNDSARTWAWGQQEYSSSGRAAAAPSGLQLASVQLVINVSGDNLTARYTVTSSSGSVLAQQAQRAQQTGNSDALVDDLFGGVSVAQFRNGLGTNRYGWTDLGFMPPDLQVAAGKTTVTIASNRFRLFLSQQYVEVHQPGDQDDPTGGVQFTYPSGLQVLNVHGASLTSTGKGSIDDQRSGGDVRATLREPGANWTTGLRSLGGVSLPVIGGPLERLADSVTAIVLLWALWRICQNLLPLRRDVRAVALAGMNAARVLVGALIALVALGFAYSLMFEFRPQGTGPWLAGPAGLALAGAVVLWPVACWRVGPAARLRAGRARGAGGHWGWDIAAMSGIGVAYIAYIAFTVGDAGPRPVSWWQVGPSVAGVVVLVYLLGRLLLGPSALRPAARLVVLLVLLAAVFTSAVAWPVIVYTGFYKGGVLYVNVIGKWVYLAAALITLVGLCVMIARVTGVLSASHRRCLAARPDGSRRRPASRSGSSARAAGGAGYGGPAPPSSSASRWPPPSPTWSARRSSAPRTPRGWSRPAWSPTPSPARTCTARCRSCSAGCCSRSRSALCWRPGGPRGPSRPGGSRRVGRGPGRSPPSGSRPTGSPRGGSRSRSCC